MGKYNNIQDIIKEAEKKNCKISELVLNDQSSEMGLSHEELREKMKKNLYTMQESVRNGLNKALRSASGLSGGNSSKIMERSQKGDTLVGEGFTRAVSYAVSVSEYNACMGRIVAAPTAGSCGIIPAVLISTMELHNKSEEEVINSLFTAAGFGIIIAQNASISGAEGGCQAECGAAAAMAAAAAVELMGGNADMCGNACAFALKNSMGLVCDPVAGLVEVPCIKRNAGLTAIALSSAELALSGVKSVIPVDEVIEALRNVGINMSYTLKETALGGIAATKTAKKLEDEIFGKKRKHL